MLPLVRGTGNVEFMDAGRACAQILAGFPDHPLGQFLDRVVSEDGIVDQRVDLAILQRFDVNNLDFAVCELKNALDVSLEFIC